MKLIDAAVTVMMMRMQEVRIAQKRRESDPLSHCPLPAVIQALE